MQTPKDDLRNLSIEELKILIESLKKENFQLREIIDNVPGDVYWKDTQGVWLGLNARGSDSLKKMGFLFNRKEVIGKTDTELFGEETARHFKANDQIVIQEKREISQEESATLQSGEKLVQLSIKRPLYNEAGGVIGIIGNTVDITYLKKIESSLHAAKEQAESANRAKTEFLANMSHDVKTPMTGVVSVADLMRTRPDWRTPEKAEMIYSCGLQVLNFFNSCLELSKLETAEWSSAEEEFSLKDLLEEIYALFLPRAMSKGLQFTIEYDTALPQTLLGHQGSVYRVILNLVGNALKFTETGSVQLRAFLVESLDEKNIRVGIEVKDTGVGIPENKQQIIFEKLRRLTPSYQGKIEGSGIGLYIVDQYVKHMDGSINVESTVGKGSTFNVRLPMTIASTLSLSKNTAEKVFTETNPSSPVTPPIIAPANFGGSFTDETRLAADAPRILLVEDSALIQVVTKMLLNDAGFAVDIAGSGEEAVEMFAPEKHSVVYMDIGLPVMNGYQTSLAIRAKEQMLNTKIKTPIIALTGHGAMDVQAFCSAAEMQGILSKPLSRAQAEKVWQRYGKHELIEVPGLTVLENDPSVVLDVSMHKYG